MIRVVSVKVQECINVTHLLCCNSESYSRTKATGDVPPISSGGQLKCGRITSRLTSNCQPRSLVSVRRRGRAGRNGESSKRRREREDSIELLRGGGSAESGRCTGHNLRSFQCGTMLRLGNIALRSTYRTVRIVQRDPLPVLPFTPPERAPEAHRSRPRSRSPKKERLIRPLRVLSLQAISYMPQ